MPIFLLPMLLSVGKWLMGPLGKYVLLALAVLGMILGARLYIVHVRHAERAAVMAELKAADAKEHTRRDQVLKDTLMRADKADREVAGLHHDNEKLKDEIKRLSAAHDNQPCLDAGSVQRLRALGH